MTEKIKKRLIHFETRGNIIEDFVAARRKRVRSLRRIIHTCFYVQCAAVLVCIAAIIMAGVWNALAVAIVGALAVCGCAFVAMGGGNAAKTALYLMDMVYSVICFVTGAVSGVSALSVCGIIMLLAALAALVGYFASWCREYLLDFSPARISRSDYTRIGITFTEQTADIGAEAEPLPQELPPPPPPKSELMLLAEQLSETLNKPEE
jgi:hypothetical protein